jgi:hypothetical protein
MMIHLDRLVSSEGLEKTYAGGRTTWEIPYLVPADGSEGELAGVAEDGRVLTLTRDDDSTASVEGEDLTAEVVHFGITYPFRYTFSRLHLRKDKTNQSAVADPRGKLQLRTFTLYCSEADDLVVTVEGVERASVDYAFTAADEASFRVPVLGNTEMIRIHLSNHSPLGARITGASWEGYWHSRNRTR